MMRRVTHLLIGLTALAAGAGPGRAQETITYSYDALGRLTTSQHSGVVNNGLAGAVCYDAAGNRTVLQASLAGTLPTCPAAPPAGNQPPVTAPNSLSAPKCVQRSVDVVANDSDPDGHLPLTLIAVDQPWAAVASPTTISLTTPDTNGVYAVTYTIADALGATATGILTVTVTGSQQCA